MREKFVLRKESGKSTVTCLTSVIVAIAFSFLGNAYGQAFNCATWGDEKTQLLQLEVGESKTFQLPTASLDPNGASCVDDVDDIQYEVRRSTDPVLPDGFTFDEEDVTVSGCSTEVLSGHKFSLVATGPDACSCTPATLEVVFRIKDDDDDETDPMCSTTGTPPVEDSEELDQTPPPKPFYGWSQVHLGGRWTQPAGPDETEQGAALTYGARCTGKYDLAENYIGSCPAFLNFIGQSTYENGIVYFTESISDDRDNIGIYRIRVTAHKEDVTATSQTTVVLEVVDDHPAPDSPVITTPALNTLHLAWEVDADEREYITGFDLEFRKVLGGGRSELYELANTVTSLTIGSLETDTQYQARLRIRGGRWSDWVQAYTLGNDAPTFEETEYTFTLTENVSGRGGRIRLGQVEATDPNPQDSVTYSLDSADTDRFTIGASSGILYYIGDGEDHEATPTINVKVTATGGTGARELESTVMVTVEVTNVSEPLAFAEDARAVVDDLTLGDYVEIQLPLAIGGDGPVSYSVDPDLPDALEIVRRTGKLKGTATVTTKRTSYTYTATDIEGETDSLTFSFRVFGKAPKAPTNLAVQRAHADRITITWENPSTPFVPVVEHEIEYRAKGTSRWKRKRIDAPATSYTITGLTRNTTYQIRVKNVAESGHVGFSSIFEAETRPYATPSAPRNVTLVEASTETLTVEWDKPADNGGRRVVVYDVRYREKGAGTWIEEETRTTSFTITGLEQGTEYLIGVRAVNVAGTGPWSDDLSASTIQNSRPIFAMGTSIPNQSYKVGEAISTLELPLASEGDGYLVYSLSPTPPPGVRFNPNVRTLSGTPTATQTTTTYSYTVADSDEFTEDDESVLTFEITVAANTPLSPALMIEDIGYESAQISWSMPDARGSNITSYDLELRESGQQSNVTQHGATSTSFTATNLLPQTAYEVRIRAINDVGPSDWSVWMEFTTTKVPVEIRSRPLIHALGVAGTLLGENAVERIGNRANLIDSAQRPKDEGYTPPYYFGETDYSLVPKFNGSASTVRVHNEYGSSVRPYARLLSMLPRSANFVLNNSSGPTDAENGIDWAAWASFDTTGRDANPMEVVNNEEIVSSLDAQTTSFWLGAEFEVAEDVRLGIAVSHATGDVDIDRLQNGSISNTEQDNVEFSLTSLHPYAVGKLHEQLRVWGTLGRGTGSTTLTDRWGKIDDLGLTATVLAAGVHFHFDENGENGFALKGDLFQSDIDTDETEDFEGSLSNTVRRLRVGVQGRRYYTAVDIDLVLTGEFLGRFEDGGIADGTNFDIGGQVDVFFNENWSASGQLRFVRSMEADAYQSLGFQFDIRRESATDGSGMSLQFTPSWGNSSLQEHNLDLKLPLYNSFDSPISGVRADIELAYGITSDRQGLIEPYGVVSRFDQGNQLKLGVRITDDSVGFGRSSFDLSSFTSIEKDRTNSGVIVAGRITF
ncbi:MAG: hypothetical protein F4X56_04390 [Gammaproteobacteria bacterium]|nr:hypothetical protein [Gammaproteobacteria bacterium]